MSPVLDITVSAPGKIILSGEHSVVYAECPAIAASINRRTACRLRTVPERTVRIELTSLSYTYVLSLDEMFNLEVLSTVGMILPEAASSAVQNALRIILLLLRTIPFTMRAELNTGLVFTVTSDLVLGAGSGSSAAFAVCVAGSVYTLARWLISQARADVESISALDCGIEVFSPEARESLRGLEKYSVDIHHWNTVENNDKEIINLWAFQAEKITHGKPSGLDNTICTFGGLVRLRRLEAGGNHIDRIENIFPLEIVLIDTGVSRSTADLVKKVAALKTRHEEIFSQLLTALCSITDRFTETLKSLANLKREDQREAISNEFQKLEDLVSMNQGLLVSLGVSHPSLNQIIDICRGHTLTAKLTGAGGGGFAFAIVPPVGFDRTKLDQCIAELARARYTVTADVQLGGPGIELKENVKTSLG